MTPLMPGAGPPPTMRASLAMGLGAMDKGPPLTLRDQFQTHQAVVAADIKQPVGENPRRPARVLQQRPPRFGVLWFQDGDLLILCRIHLEEPQRAFLPQADK